MTLTITAFDQADPPDTTPDLPAGSRVDYDIEDHRTITGNVIDTVYRDGRWYACIRWQNDIDGVPAHSDVPVASIKPPGSPSVYRFAPGTRFVRQRWPNRPCRLVGPYLQADDRHVRYVGTDGIAWTVDAGADIHLDPCPDCPDR